MVQPKQAIMVHPHDHDPANLLRLVSQEHLTFSPTSAGPPLQLDVNDKCKKTAGETTRDNLSHYQVNKRMDTTTRVA